MPGLFNYLFGNDNEQEEPEEQRVDATEDWRTFQRQQRQTRERHQEEMEQRRQEMQERMRELQEEMQDQDDEGFFQRDTLADALPETENETLHERAENPEPHFDNQPRATATYTGTEEYGGNVRWVNADDYTTRYKPKPKSQYDKDKQKLDI